MQIFLIVTLAYAVLTAWAPRWCAVSVPQIAIFAALMIFTIKRKLRFAMFLSIPAALAIIGAAQWITSHTADPYRTANATLDWAGYAAFALLAVQPGIAPERLLRWWLYFSGVLGTTSILTALTSPFHLFWIVPVRFEQVFGPYVYRNHLAAFAELSLPIALTYAIRDRERRPLFALIAGILVASVITAQSRTGLILIVAELLAFLAIAAHKSWLTPSAAIVIVSAILGATIVTGVSGVTARFAEEHPYRVRLEILESTLDMARARPFTGWGLGSFRTVYPRFARIDPGVLVNEAHNDWAQWGAEAGAISVILLLAFAIWAFRAGLRTGWALGIAAVFCHALVDYPFEEPSLVLLLMLLAGLAWSDAHSPETPRSHQRSVRRRSRPTTRESLPV